MTDQEKLEQHYLTMYPTQNELRETDERLATAMHNYIVIGQAQLYIRKVRTKYSVCCRGWKPRETHYKGGYMEITRTESLKQAKKTFLAAAAKLIQEEFQKWDVSFQLQSAYQTDEQYKHLVEIVQTVEQLENSQQ